MPQQRPEKGSGNRLTLPRHSRVECQAIERLKTFRGHVRSIPETIAKLFSLGNPKTAKPSSGPGSTVRTNVSAGENDRAASTCPGSKDKTARNDTAPGKDPKRCREWEGAHG